MPATGTLRRSADRRVPTSGGEAARGEPSRREGLRHAGRTSLVPDACEPAEGVRVAVQRNDAEEVAARRPEDTAVKPPAELDRPQGEEPGGLGRYVVGLDVDVVAGLVVHRLYRGDQPGKRAGQRGELRLAGHRVRRHAERR